MSDSAGGARTACVVGSGGREHALAVSLAQSAEVVVTPGNPGIAGSVSTPPTELDADLFVIGPEVPLVAGLADELRAQGKRVFGPGADGAQIEGSKAWMKELLVAADLPTAQHGTFSAVEPALAFLQTMPGFYVVKTDGLAAGKGVLVTESLAEAELAVREYLAGERFGDAGRTVVIEEGLTGPEVSLLAVCDGRRTVPLVAAQDHKRIGDGDTGPNTGGMGAYSPVPMVDAAMVDGLMNTMVEPTLAALQNAGINYRGVLFAGLMLTPDGPKMLEYNCRFGDPETQVVLPRMTSDLFDLLAGAADGVLPAAPTFSDDAAVTVVLASEGYPVAPRAGDVIAGLEAAQAIDGVQVYCAGVGAGGDGSLITAGGRVLNVTAVGADVGAARALAYEAADLITWPGVTRREDIAAAAS